MAFIAIPSPIFTIIENKLMSILLSSVILHRSKEVRTIIKKSSKRGFTLIELITVMVIIGILVLIATPKFINYIKKSKYTNIINDIRVVESVSLAEIVLTSEFPLGTDKNETGDIDIGVQERRAYRKDGLIIKNKDDDYKPYVGKISEKFAFDLGKYYKLSKDEFVIKETKTILTGNFYINDDGDIIYIHTSSLGGI